MTSETYNRFIKQQEGFDFRTDEVEKFKAENEKVIGLLEELAAKKAELVDKTPFDNFESNLPLQVIDSRLNEIYALIHNNPKIKRQYVEKAIEPIEDSLTQLHEKVDQLLPKGKNYKETLPLRDPIDMNLFPIFFTNAVSQATRQKDLKQSQLRVAYTLLYYKGLRVNEIRLFQEKDIQNAIKTSQFSVVHFKQKEPHIHVISEEAVRELKKLKNQLDGIFVNYKDEYLFGKSKPIGQRGIKISVLIYYICMDGIF